jgi:hypothetical protein
VVTNPHLGTRHHYHQTSAKRYKTDSDTVAAGTAVAAIAALLVAVAADSYPQRQGIRHHRLLGGTLRHHQLQFVQLMRPVAADSPVKMAVGAAAAAERRTNQLP